MKLALAATAVWAGSALAYDPGCPFAAREPVVLPMSAHPLLFVPTKWCGLAQAPSMSDPTLACQAAGDFRTVLWRRHERASDPIWIPQAQITLRAGPTWVEQMPYRNNYTLVADPDTTVGGPGDVVVLNSDPFFTGVLEVERVWQDCDSYWNGPLTGLAANPKGIVVVSVNRLTDEGGNDLGLGFAICNSLLKPYLAVADPTHSLNNERSLATGFGLLLGMPVSFDAGNLMDPNGGGATLTLAQCLDARARLAANPVIDPPNMPSNRVAFVIDPVDTNAPQPWLDVTKTGALDDSPLGGDLRLVVAGRRPIPDNTNFVAYFLLDADNNPFTGATNNNIVPGQPATGMDFVGRVVRVGTNVTAALFRKGPLGNFVSVALPAGSLTGVIRQAEYVLINPRSGQSNVTRQAFSEVELRISNGALATAGLDVQVGTIRSRGLFPAGLRFQSLVQAQNQTSQFDFAPDTASMTGTNGAVRFPQIEFPTMTLPAAAAQGEEITLTVNRMQPSSQLKVFIGPDLVHMGAQTDTNGSATVRVRVPCSPPGPTLVTVGHLQPALDATADAVLEIRPTQSSVIARQPVSQSVVTGSNATFTVAAVGLAPLAYQWSFNNAPIAGATGTSLTLSNAQAINAGTYAVVVSNPYGSVASAMATLTVLPPLITTVKINEWMADNQNVIADEDNTFQDWVELYNAGPNPVNLLNWHLTDQANNLSLWTLPATNLPPGGYLLIFASAKDRRIPGQPLHTNFKLSSSGEFLGLSMPSGILVDSIAPAFEPQTANISQGRFPNGGDPLYFMPTPTPGAANIRPAVVTQAVTVPFALGGTDATVFKLFNVLTPGPILATVTWQGASPSLSMELQGRRRPQLPVPTMPYATASGGAPLSLSYQVTDEDVARGVSWRLVVKSPAGLGTSNGVITLSYPTDPALNARFLREKISLRSGDFWPASVLQSQFLGRLASAPAGGLHGVITLNRAVDCMEADQLEALGLSRQSHLAGPGRHAFGYVRRGIDLQQPLIAAVLRQIIPLEPEDKVEPNVLLGNFSKFVVTPENGPPQNYVRNPDGTLKLSVLFAKDVSVERIRAILQVETLSFSPTSDSLWQCTASASRLAVLAGYDEVEWIEGGPMPKLPDNSTTRPFVGVDAVQNATINPAGAGTITYNGFSGNGVTVGIEDNGIDATHPDLTVAVNTAALGKHATHVAGIVAASGFQSTRTDINGNANGGTLFQFRGMAPRAALIDSQDLITTANLLAAIQNNSLDIINQSQTITTDGNYDGQNQTVDQEIRGGATSGGTKLPRRLRVTSAGNNGTSPQRGNQFDFFAISKQMKNVVVVGNWDARAGQNILSGSSSMGPMHDGRIKPDVMAPGSVIRSTGASPVQAPPNCSCYCPNSANGYNTCSGTSMSSPCVAGIGALLLEAWQTTYNAPLATTLAANPPLPSTLRALLIGTAQDIVNNNVGNRNSTEVDADSNQANGIQAAPIAATAGPDFATGWGQVNAQGAAALIQDFRTESGRRVPNRIIQDSIDQAVTLEYDFVVAQAQAFSVTLAWDDVEAAVQNPATMPMLVNDLDLELVAPDGTTIFYPWQLGQTIRDLANNPLANNAQPPGTAIQVQIPISAVAPPGLASGTAGPPEYVPANAMTGNGVWVAARGKDHLNNVEQVAVTAGQATIGHWKMRVIGFDVKQGPQDYSLVGFPYPQLPELVASSSAKVNLSAFGTPINFTWKVENTGPVGTGVGFTYKVWISRDFYVNAGDVALTGELPLAALGASPASQMVSSSVMISQAQADQLLGTAPGTTTLQNLVDSDVFLLVQVDGPNAVLEHNESNVTFIHIGRPTDVVLVMDRSGSMGANIPVSSGTRTKLDLLKDSANLFLDLMRVDANDQLSEVSFSGNVTTDFTAGGGLTPYTAGNVATAKGALPVAAAGSTDIRAGLQRGLDVMTAGGLAGHRKVVIFFSDGMKTAGGDPRQASFLQQFTSQDIKVYSVGFGTRGGDGLTGIDVNLLQQLSNVNPGNQGFFHVTESSEALDKFFVNAVAGAVRSEVVVDPEADIFAGARHTVDAVVNSQDYSATFILTWDRPTGNLDLAVRSPAGFEVSAANAAFFGAQVSAISRSTYKLVTVRFPLQAGASKSHAGHWTMVIRNTGAGTVHYSASVLAESGVRADMPQPRSAGGGSFQPLENIPFNFSLNELRSRPVRGATVTLTPNVPLVSVGSLLSAAGITATELALIPTTFNGEDRTLAERMYRALVQRVGGSNLMLRADGPSFVLPETSPGQYGGCYFNSNFPGTQIEGAYTFIARADGFTTNCERFQREVTRTVGVGSQVHTQAMPPITVGWIDPNSPTQGVLVSFSPIALSRQFLGPGLSGMVTVTGTGGVQAASALIDNLNGSYSQAFRITQAGLAAFNVTVGGVVLPPLMVDTRLPAPIAVTPASGFNDLSNSITVMVASNSNLSAVTGLSLVAGDVVIPLSGFSANSNQARLFGLVPTGLAAGPYAVHLESALGRGPGGATFQVLTRGQNYPPGVDLFTYRLGAVLAARTPAEARAQLGLLLRDLRDLPVGVALTEQARLLAFNEALQLLTTTEGMVSADRLAALHAALNAARIDTRFAAQPGTFTPAGANVRVNLGNGVAVTFSSVLASGTTTLQVTPGPAEVDEPYRGTPHVAYNLGTTAQLGAGATITVELNYQPADFVSESMLRFFHLEGGVWVDRTFSLNPGSDLLTARTTTLGSFVVVQVVPAAPVLHALGFDPTNRFMLQLEAPPGTYVIDWSSNLTQWISAVTNTVGLTPVTFIDPTSGRTGSRFYRARSQ